MSLKYAVLGLLKTDTYYGYEIKQKFENSLGEMWPISYGQLYPTLQRLEDSGYVIKRKEAGKKAIDKNVYTITEKGRNYFNTWWYTLPKKPHITVKDEFSLLFLFQNEENYADFEEIIAKQKELLLKLHARYKRQLRYLTLKSDKYRRNLVKKMLLHIEAELTWLQGLAEEYQ
jgi:PadR family transcriptional regulator, regulatory protein AphA